MSDGTKSVADSPAVSTLVDASLEVATNGGVMMLLVIKLLGPSRWSMRMSIQMGRHWSRDRRLKVRAHSHCPLMVVVESRLRMRSVMALMLGSKAMVKRIWSLE